MLGLSSSADFLTLRTFSAKEDSQMGRGPVFIHQAAEVVLQEARRLYQDWNLLLDETPVSPVNCLFAGNVMLEVQSHEGFGIGHMLVVDHLGSVVRDIEHSGVPLEFNIHGNVRGPRDEIIPDLTAVVHTLMKFPYFNGPIFEFSIYPFGTGCYNKNIIWWEVRRKS
ncbi:MAG: hypothetical protein UY48_C0027G0003 [Candidatus Gottesmanbacteria bacterium GW2011_GWB1_49_7]|uniref:Uncharacterized protein n=1 Tax=Candidatus Gottesmanbacteria bacterium GW2011_GWB1_49_7 TaxID=1618448 RepID=A0A0G1VX12_9BACT|nr:MAG: hypothetical protein UY48_C0027G0003 [Candidatus Gottesmanbacteria bacterium GW2011_GWB1_49_7]